VADVDVIVNIVSVEKGEDEDTDEGIKGRITIGVINKVEIIHF
jgi:hypothetical protein